MSITSEQVTHIARLARLGTAAVADGDGDGADGADGAAADAANADAESYASQLSRIMELVEQMNRVDTDHITPMSHPQQAGMRLRADKVNAENQREVYQRIAPATEQGLYLVPRVIE